MHSEPSYAPTAPCTHTNVYIYTVTRWLNTWELLTNYYYRFCFFLFHILVHSPLVGFFFSIQCNLFCFFVCICVLAFIPWLSLLVSFELSSTTALTCHQVGKAGCQLRGIVRQVRKWNVRQSDIFYTPCKYKRNF